MKDREVHDIHIASTTDTGDHLHTRPLWMSRIEMKNRISLTAVTRRERTLPCLKGPGCRLGFSWDRWCTSGEMVVDGIYGVYVVHIYIYNIMCFCGWYAKSGTPRGCAKAQHHQQLSPPALRLQVTKGIQPLQLCW